METYHCYTDGSALNNPGPGGWAWVLLDGDTIIAKNSGGELHATNNQMELQAVINVLETHLPRTARPVVDQGLFSKPVIESTHETTYEAATINIILTTDSTYVQQGVTKRLDTRVRRGWRRSTGGKSIANVEQRMKLHSMLVFFPSIERRRTKAHVGTKRNERVDTEARRQAIYHSKTV